MDHIFETILHILPEALRMLPFLFGAYLLMEYMEHKAPDRLKNLMMHTRGSGAVVGALLGCVPQCGFSVAAANLFAGGVVTGGNASPLNDGAAAAIMMEEEKAKAMGLKPLMRFVDYATIGVDPRYMGIGPVGAMQKLMQRNGMTINDFDFIEVNEAFAAQTLAVQRQLNIPMEKLNIRGGAIALGHPYSATGINLAAKAAGIFARGDYERCAIAFCCGGGQGVAAIFEKC